jgi:glycosyltransferase involved in cell wall biosynthesis
MGSGEQLWGKERVIALLMREQRASGRIDPMLVAFSAGKLANVLAGEGFQAAVLSPYPTHGFGRTVGRLSRVLEKAKVDVVHSHGYRANIIARALRLGGCLRGVRLISTCHGWIESTPKLRLYNAVDRWSSMLSDVTTVPDRRMLRTLPWWTRRRHVPNAVPDLADAGDDPAARAGAFVAGTLGRVNAEKGIPELLAAADGFPDRSVVFTVAGDGELTSQVREAGGNVRYVGYLANADRYLAGLDVYVQASRSEGLSLALLEAMRAGKPIVATDVGATSDAVVDGESALVVPARRPAALRDAVLALRVDPANAARLGRNARARFEADFHMQRQHQRFLDLYASNGDTP